MIWSEENENIKGKRLVDTKDGSVVRYCMSFNDETGESIFLTKLFTNGGSITPKSVDDEVQTFTCFLDTKRFKIEDEDKPKSIRLEPQTGNSNFVIKEEDIPKLGVSKGSMEHQLYEPWEPRKPEIKIVSGDSILGVEGEINTLLKEGWQLGSNIQTTSHNGNLRFTQLLTKY